MNLTTENTAIVVDSTADFPEAPERFPNWRVVPLYVRFGEESFRDYVELAPDAFYERLRRAEQTPTTSQPTPADFLTAYEELAGYDRILSLHIAGKLSGTIESARTAARMLGDDRVRTIDSESASVAIATEALSESIVRTRSSPSIRAAVRALSILPESFPAMCSERIRS